jgi:hypothetical protein
MTSRALFDAARTRVSVAHWDSGYSFNQVEQALYELKQILNELQLRGDQLTIPPAQLK